MFIKTNPKRIFLLLLGILLAILAISTISDINAADNNESKTITSNNDNYNNKILLNSDNSIESYININSKNYNNIINHIKLTANIKNKSKTKKTMANGCCSIILHVNSSSYVYGYRRDASYAANIYVKKVKIYGMEGLREYKTKNTYFFHSLILKNGFYIGAGGRDNPKVNKYLEKLGAEMAYKNKITVKDLNKAKIRVKSLGIGHFVIKSPAGNVGMVIYNNGRIKTSIFKMKDGEYLSIPNSPSLFRKGKYTIKKSSPVDAAIYIGGSDRFGVNRRNMMIYDVKNVLDTSMNTETTTIDIWVTNDNGKYVGKASNRADIVIFNKKKIFAKSIPKIPNKKYVGTLLLI